MGKKPSSGNPGMETGEVDIQALIRDLSRHQAASEAILALGERAVPELSAYLNGNAESIPQGRVFAVEMLAAIPGEAATEALRHALYHHDLRTLSPDLAHAEQIVKNTALGALTHRLKGDPGAEIAYGLEVARLPAAAEAAARFGRVEHIPSLISALDDDSLGNAAQKALEYFGKAAVPALLAVLEEKRVGKANLRRQISAMDILATVGSQASLYGVRRLLDHPHPALAAATALALRVTDSTGELERRAYALSRGALLPETALARRCLDALASLPPEILARTGTKTLELETVPDYYGDPHPLTDVARAPLAGVILRTVNAAHVAGGDEIAHLPIPLLLLALRECTILPPGPVAQVLARHADPAVRRATARVLAASGEPAAAQLIVRLLRDGHGAAVAVHAGLDRLAPMQRRRLLEAIRAGAPPQWRAPKISREIRYLDPSN